MRPYAQPQRHNMRQNGVFFMPRKAADMCEGPLISRIILYTIPIILTGVLQLLFNAADLVVVGRCCGSNSVGAVGSTGAIINLMVNLFIGLSVGAGVTVAHGLSRWWGCCFPENSSASWTRRKSSSTSPHPICASISAELSPA